MQTSPLGEAVSNGASCFPTLNPKVKTLHPKPLSHGLSHPPAMVGRAYAPSTSMAHTELDPPQQSHGHLSTHARPGAGARAGIFQKAGKKMLAVVVDQDGPALVQILIPKRNRFGWFGTERGE